MPDVENGNLGVVKNISFALERLMDIHQDLRPHSSYLIQNKKNTKITISLDVIIRGIISELPAKEANAIIVAGKHKEWLNKQIVNQIERITLLSNNLDKIELVIHNTNYSYIEKGEAISVKINWLIKNVSKRFVNSLTYFNITNNSDLLMTNNPFDLLKVTKQLVLNTHNGDVLTKLELNKKLKSSKTINMLSFPYNETTVKIFGERYKYYLGLPISTRRKVYDVLKDVVTPTTSESKLKSLIKNKLGKEII